MDDKGNFPRVKGNFTTTAKGLAQIDVTAEASTAEEMGKLLKAGYDEIVSVVKGGGITLAHEAEGK